MGQSGVKKDAFALQGQATNAANNSLNTISPIYAQEAQNPAGYTPQQRANMLTASNQSLGGAVAGAVGQGALYGARTNNAGASTAALDDAARNAMAQQSQNALGVENDNAVLMEKQKQEGLAGLNSIYDTGSGNAIKALDVANQAQKPFWQQLLMAGVQGAGQVASAYAGK